MLEQVDYDVFAGVAGKQSSVTSFHLIEDVGSELKM